MTTIFLSISLLFFAISAEGLSLAKRGKGSVTRRIALGRALSSPIAALVSIGGAVAVPSAASAVDDSLALSSSEAEQRERLRATLLSAVESRSPDDAAILLALEALVRLDPSGGRGASSESAADLGGEWRLLWSAGAEAFSPLLTLPRPFRPDSYQYLGAIASAEVGEGRVAQGLTGGLLGRNQLWLSSGVVSDEDDLSVLDIKPPFRFQIGGRIGTGTPKKTIVEAGSDAEFRAANVRTLEAQQAPPNKYKQLYLESGGSGSLRISTITEGDPVIVGAIFVHQKI